MARARLSWGVLGALDGTHDVRGATAEIVLYLGRRSAYRGDDLLRPRQASVRRGNLVEAAKIFPQRRQFLGLVGEQRPTLPAALGVRSHRFEPCRRLGSTTMCVGHGVDERCIHAVVVEQAPLLVGAHDESMLVLTVDVDQRRGQSRQHRRRHGCSVDEGPRTPLGTCGPAHKTIALLFGIERILLAKHGECLRLPGNIELGTHVAAAGAGPDL